MIRVALPQHLRNLARLDGEARVRVDPPINLRSVLDALEDAHPVLRGTIRDHGTLRRRAFVRFFVLERDWSLESPEVPLPDEIATGAEPLRVIGSMAGG